MERLSKGIMLLISMVMFSFVLAGEVFSLTCVAPSDNMLISSNTAICGGNYTIDDQGSTGVLIINSSNITLEWGQEIIKLYYEWGPVITKVMEEDEQFRKQVKGMMDGVLEWIMEGVE